MHLIDGHLADTVPVDDRGLAYGDGVFRTLRRRDGVVCWWTRHYARLANDCAALGMACPSSEELEADLAKLPPDCVAKIVVTRGSGRRGYAPLVGAPVRRIVSASPLPAYPDAFVAEGVKVHLCSLRLADQPRLAGVKHLNRLENVLARMEWDDPGTAEGILLDAAGNGIEGTMSNLFVYRGGVLETPLLDRCGVVGVQRARILEAAGRLGLATREVRIPLETLMKADEVLLCNSLIGIWQVREFNGRVWPRGDLSARLRFLLSDCDA